MKRRVWQRALSLAFLFAMAIILINPVSVQAKTKKLKPAWANITCNEASYIESKAVTVTKTGNYKVEIKKGGGYYSGFIKFVVPETKKYAFVFSKVRAKGKSTVLAYSEFSMPTGIEDQITMISGSTKGKYSNQYPFAYRAPGGKKHGNVPTRTVYYQLTEGQVVYIRITNSYYSTKGKKVTFNLKIK